LYKSAEFARLCELGGKTNSAESFPKLGEIAAIVSGRSDLASPSREAHLIERTEFYSLWGTRN